MERIALDAQLPLSVFEETQYAAREFYVLPGDRLLFVSDGVYDAASPVGEIYGQRAPARAIRSTRLLPAATVPRAVLRELAGFRRADSTDDALVVCLDGTGGPDIEEH